MLSVPFGTMSPELVKYTEKSCCSLKTVQLLPWNSSTMEISLTLTGSKSIFQRENPTDIQGWCEI